MNTLNLCKKIEHEARKSLCHSLDFTLVFFGFFFIKIITDSQEMVEAKHGLILAPKFKKKNRGALV